MPTVSGKPLIVISYAHADEPENPAEGEVKWLSFVTGYLRPAIKHGAVDLWLDRLMPGGADWEPEIEQKLRVCDIFILLVSRHSLSSDYVVNKEIALIRERQAKGETVHFYPLVLTPTTQIALDLVRDKNLRPRDGKPLSDYPLHERYRQMAEIADEIAAIAKKVTEREDEQPPPAWPRFDATHRTEVEIKEAGSVRAWLNTQGREVVVAFAARAALRSVPAIAYRPANEISNLACAVFRATAMALIVVKYPTHADELRRFAGAAAEAARTVEGAYAASAAIDALLDDDATTAALRATDLAASEVSVLAYNNRVTTGGDSSAALAAGKAARDYFWEEIFADATGSALVGASVLADRPLWAAGRPSWSESAWFMLLSALPNDEGWEIWFDWYEQRQRGGSRGEEYELVFASVPQAEWGKGPAAANAWIRDHLPAEELQATNGAFSLEAWLITQTRETATAIAVRAAARVAPLAARITRKGPDPRRVRELTHLAGVIFRALGSARVSVQDSDRLFISSARNAAGAASASSVIAIVGGDVARAAMFATSAAANSAAAAAAANPHASGPAAAAVRASVDAFVSADLSASDADTAAWNEILADVEATQRGSVSALLEAPLWRQGEPKWAPLAVKILQAALPEDEDWDVWLDWYEQRLHGGSLGDDYELVFAGVPLEEWDKGPAAANAWIKAHLPDRPAALADLPKPLPDLDSPFTYGWNANWQVAIIAGAQNLPHLRFSSSEDDHRQTLDACRKSAERLLKEIQDDNYGNAVRREYSLRLQYYVEDLPVAQGRGNILLANDQIVVLRAMLADDDAVSFPFAAGLNRVINKQAALNDFYDVVRRHEEAVAKGRWTQPFPVDAAKRFFGVVGENSPRFFEPEVSEGIRRVEQAAPWVELGPDERRQSSRASEPRPLPSATLAPERSRQHQIATTANALWEVFLKGKDLPVALDGWTRAAHKLGENVGPLLDFLRGLGGT